MAKFQGEEVNPSNWLKASDLEGGSRIVEIESAAFEDVGDKNTRTLVLRFANEPKGLILNKTNTNRIEDISREPMVENWIGTAIELYVDKMAYKGQIREAIRVRLVRNAALVGQPNPEPR